MKVLIMSVKAGFGHHSTAQAIIDYFGEKDVECTMLDTFEYINPVLADSIDNGYLFSTKYIPDIYGKEKRKRASSKEGKLGVEGVSNQVIIDAVQRCGIEMTETPNPKGNKITKQDLYALGLSGRSNSAVLRKAVIQKLQLPEHLSANGFLEVVNLLYTTEELQDIVDKI
jgi:ribonuclease M5